MNYSVDWDGPGEREAEHEWMVPMKFLRRGRAFVMARSAEEALEKANAGDVICRYLDESFEWTVNGEPELNE